MHGYWFIRTCKFCNLTDNVSFPNKWSNLYLISWIAFLLFNGICAIDVKGTKECLMAMTRYPSFMLLYFLSQLSPSHSKIYMLIWCMNSAMKILNCGRVAICSDIVCFHRSWQGEYASIILLCCIQVCLFQVLLHSEPLYCSSLTFYCGGWPCHSFTDNCFLTMFFFSLKGEQPILPRILMPCKFRSEPGLRGNKLRSLPVVSVNKKIQLKCWTIDEKKLH